MSFLGLSCANEQQQQKKVMRTATNPSDFVGEEKNFYIYQHASSFLNNLENNDGEKSLSAFLHLFLLSLCVFHWFMLASLHPNKIYLPIWYV